MNQKKREMKRKKTENYENSDIHIQSHLRRTAGEKKRERGFSMCRQNFDTKERKDGLHPT